MLQAHGIIIMRGKEQNNHSHMSVSQVVKRGENDQKDTRLHIQRYNSAQWKILIFCSYRLDRGYPCYSVLITIYIYI